MQVICPRPRHAFAPSHTTQLQCTECDSPLRHHNQCEPAPRAPPQGKNRKFCLAVTLTPCAPALFPRPRQTWPTNSSSKALTTARRCWAWRSRKRMGSGGPWPFTSTASAATSSSTFPGTNMKAWVRHSLGDEDCPQRKHPLLPEAAAAHTTTTITTHAHAHAHAHAHVYAQAHAHAHAHLHRGAVAAVC